MPNGLLKDYFVTLCLIYKVCLFLCLYFPGADIDCCDKIGNTPLHIAARYGHDLLINTLLENGSDPTR